MRKRQLNLARVVTNKISTYSITVDRIQCRVGRRNQISNGLSLIAQINYVSIVFPKL